MIPPIHLIQGGSDAKNGDYSEILRMARTGRESDWSCPKHTRSGDGLLIYFQLPHSEIVAVAQAMSDAVPGNRWRYEARIGGCSFWPTE